MEQKLMSPLNSVSIAPECITKFNELKLGKTIKYIIYKLSDDYKEIVVEETSEDKNWDNFREKLVNAKSKTKTVDTPTPHRIC
jgi:cofilin